jgi:hypothetical protein
VNDNEDSDQQQQPTADGEQQQPTPLELDPFHEAKVIGQQLAQRFNFRTLYGDQTASGVSMKPMVEAAAAGKLLVDKGFCTEQEWLATCAEITTVILREVLRQAEEQKLQAVRDAQRPVTPMTPMTPSASDPPGPGGLALPPGYATVAETIAKERHAQRQHERQQRLRVVPHG